MRKGFLQEDEAKMSSTPVQLEGVSGHRLDGGNREAELAVRLVKQSVWSVEETVTEEWFAGKFYEASIKYDLFLGQPWLHAHRVSPMGHRTCFLQDLSTSDPSDLYYLHPYTKSIHQFKERNKLHIQQDGQEWTGNQEEFDEGKSESLNCKKWKSVCYRVVDKWQDILVDYFERNNNFRPQVDAFANKKNQRFPKFYDEAWSGDWSESLWINPPFDVFPRVVQKLKQSGAKGILIVPNWPKQSWFKDIMDISIDIVELPHKEVKLYCEDNGKPLPQRSWSTLACLVDGNLGDYWQDDSEIGTEEVISNSSRIKEIGVDRDDQEQNPDVSSRKEGRTIVVPRENASIHYNWSPSDKNQADDEVWNEVAKNMRPRPTIRKLVDIMSVIKCGNQVDGDKVSARRDAVFEDYKDDVLSGKLWENPPIPCENGEAMIEIIQGSKVHKQRPFYLHRTKADALRKIIERNLNEFGWLEGCMSSEWCSAPFTVPKPPPADQSSIDAWRLEVDYRALNAATVPDAHPLPLIEKGIAARAKGKLFTVLDFRHGFHQMPLRKEDRHLTAMCTPCGTVQWTVLPMGLKNPPSMFQKMMETILFQKHKSLDLQEFCSIYIDDLLIATPLGKNFDECLKLHDEQVRNVLEVLRQEKLVCGPKKGEMFLQSVEFCGSVLEDGTRRPAPGKMAALHLWERFKTITQLRAFLGCCN